MRPNRPTGSPSCPKTVPGLPLLRYVSGRYKAEGDGEESEETLTVPVTTVCPTVPNGMVNILGEDVWG